MSSFQKSQEWLDRRLKSIGGSDIASVMGRNPYKTAYQLFLEKTKKVIPEDISHLPHIVRGHLSEEIARDRMERETHTAYRPKFWQHSAVEYMTASDDGFSHELNQVLEIKAMGKENHLAAKSGKIPLHYLDQIQWGLMISGCTKCIFISYRVEEDDMVCVDVFPDKKHQDELKAAADNFWLNHVQKDKAPEIQDGDYKEIKDKALESLAQEYEQLHLQQTELETKIEELKEKLRPYVATLPAVRCGRIKLLKSERAGTIDYKKYLKDKEVSDVEIEKYRKPATESFRVTIVKEPDLTTL